MAYISLYRKWRPQTFEEVVGQEYVTRTLANAVRSGNIAHAYLFAGPRGTGKTSTARILAKALNCEEGPTPNPCNHCSSCRSITDGTSVDVVEIDAASNRGIDDIRDLRERVIFTPASSRVKVYILDEAHMITKEAFNAFLKTLEEPPAHAVFVLATTEPHKLPQTILSRCQRHDFRSVPAPLLAEYLRRVAGEEGYRVTPEALRLVARRARGSVRDALVALEQLASYGDGVVEESDAAGFLGLIEDEVLLEMGESLIGGDLQAVISMVERVHEEGRDLAHFAAQVQEHFRKVLLLQHADLGAVDLEVDEDSLRRLREQASLLSPERTLHFIAAMGRAREEMKQSSSPRLVLESALIAMAREDLEGTPEAILARLKRLEGKLEGMAHREAATAALRGEARTGRAATRSGGAAAAVTEAEAAGAGPEEIKAEAGAAEVAAEPEGPREEPEAVVEEPAAAVSREDSSAAGLDLAAVRKSWARVKERVREIKVPTHALLLEGKPLRLEGDELVISFPSDRSFHYRELSKENHRRVVERALEEVLGAPLRVSAVLEEGGRGSAEAPAPVGKSRGSSVRSRRAAREGEAGGIPDTGEDEGAVERQPETAPRRAPEDVEKEVAAPVEKEAGAGEAGKVKLLKDIFGAEMVEEIKLQE
ncbi:DNA polymerase III subunit gamma/tau [Candidatus Solincola sp.]|nr:DNA polymerase III subunit gamma/tau [Actinomycetota bacterium]MDI7252160.1 DNA polymerase III subunit gamma/tau [Actinomycetota bacterium]